MEGPPAESGLWGHLARAERLIDVERYEEAERELRQALVMDPQNANVHAVLATVLKERDDLEGAEEEAFAALASDPDHIQARVVLCKIRMDQGRHEESEKFVLEALRLDPHHAGLLLVYASLMLKTGYLDKAEKLIRASLKEDPENEHAHTLLSMVLGEKRRLADSQAHSEVAMGLAPGEEGSHWAMAVAHFRSGRPFKARYHAREALRLDPATKEHEEFYLHVDMCCRWIYLPMYYYSLLIDRLPGKQFALWGVFVFGLMALRRTAPSIVGVFAISWVSLCIYTWIASPLAKAWLKIRPAR